MSNNKSKTSLIDLNKKSGANALKNKDRFAKTIAIDPRKKETTTTTPTTPVNDITDLSIAIDPILDEDVSDILDIADISDTTENGSKIDIID